MKRPVSESYYAFIRRVGEKYPWLHPDYDPDGLEDVRRARRAQHALDVAASRRITDRGGIDCAVRRSDRIGP